jgi:DNA-binding NtrC family response regulator
VLFTSGYTENAIMHGGRLDPGIELLSKPYSREALARKIRQVLASRPRRRPRTVLFVEDDALIRLNSCDILQEAGFRVLEAGSAAQALAALDANEVDICVVDVGLPDIPGTDLARRIRERDDRMPLLFATGHLGVPEAATLAGAAVLSKPYGERELRAAVESLIEQR